MDGEGPATARALRWEIASLLARRENERKWLERAEDEIVNMEVQILSADMGEAGSAARERYDALQGALHSMQHRRLVGPGTLREIDEELISLRVDLDELEA